MAINEKPPTMSPYAVRVPTPDLAQFFGDVIPRTDDPAFQPLQEMVSAATVTQAAGRIFREIPITTIQTNWTVAQTRAALDSLHEGLFDAPSQLADAIMGDDRVQATLGSRTSGLFGRPVRFRPADDSAEAKACLAAWQKCWPAIAHDQVWSEVSRWAVMLALAPAQLMWHTDGPLWYPVVRPWHPRYTFFLPQLFTYYASTQDGLVPLIPGTGQWMLHTPHGEYRGWMRGAVRAVAQPWLIRQFAYRDWARYSERHGMPIFRAKVPAAGDKEMKALFVQSLATIGQESSIMLPQGVDQSFSYDLDMLEASDQSWQSFGALIDRCDMSIVLALLWQNLTTEVKEGSFAAARVHGDVRQACLAADNASLALTIRRDLARPFAAINFGNPDLAPYTDWSVDPVEDRESEAGLFSEFARAIQALAQAGVTVVDPSALAKSQFGLDLSSGELKVGAVPNAASAMPAAPSKPVGK